MNRYECVQLLLEHGADVNLADRSFSTALHVACTLDLPDIVSLLLRYNCNLTATDIEGRFPEDIAEDNNTEDSLICLMLIKRHRNHLVYDPLDEDTWREGSEGDIRQSPSPETDMRGRYLHRLTHSSSSPKPFIAGSVLAPSLVAEPSPVSRPLSRGVRKSKELHREGPFPTQLKSLGRPSMESSRGDHVPTSALQIDTDEDDGNKTYPHSSEPSRVHSQWKVRTTSPPRSPETLPFIAGSYTQAKEREKNTLFSIYSPPAPLREKSSLFPFAPYKAPYKTPTKKSKIRITAANTMSPGDSTTPSSAEKRAMDTLRLQWVPFQPRVARFLDVIVSVEQCVDCHMHNWSSWHVEEHYTKAADETIRAVLMAMAKRYPRLRVFAFKVKNQCSYKASQRVGALEVTVTIKTSSEDNTKWSSKSIHSKLATLRCVEVPI